MSCTRCGETRKTVTMFNIRPGGHSAFRPNTVELEQMVENVCGGCITDGELVHHPTVYRIAEFALGALLNNYDESSAREELLVKHALETARAFFMVRNNENDTGRNAAVRAIGLD
jgi:hypothetical protein